MKSKELIAFISMCVTLIVCILFMTTCEMHRHEQNARQGNTSIRLPFPGTGK